MTLEISKALIDEVARGRASLFLGAGASREAGFPDADALAKHLAEEAGEPHSSKLEEQPLDAVAQYLYLEEGYGPQWVRQRVIEYLEQFHKKAKRPPSQAHEIMTRIRWRTIFTTNYDRLVEISYDMKSGCVQRELPIFAPDAQILRHEEDVVKLIKLNGSVDEAARNSSHQLVLTFAEQQEARSRNMSFYELLRAEAINGPIIFVGFSFVHPGANRKGTSPEFLLLQEILRDMGSAARWHYCVVPFDPSLIGNQINLKTLQSNRIQTINATFGEFLKTLLERLETPAVPLEKRPPIVVPIGQTSLTIDAEDYAKDKRHFEFIGSHLEKDKIPSFTESLNGYENWTSFFNGHFIERLCRKDLMEILRVSFEKAPEVISIIASAGWGKTFLLRDIAVELYRKNRPVIWLNPYSTVEFSGSGPAHIIVGTWDMRRIDQVVSQINDKAKEHSFPIGEGTPILISDNCTERTEEVLSLFRYLTGNNRRFIILTAFRDTEYEEIKKGYPILERCRKFRPEGLYDPRTEVKNLVEFCAEHKVASFENAAQKEIVAQRVIDSEAETAILLALQIIFDKQHRPFTEIVKGIWQDLQDPTAKKLVLRVAALHRFGSAFYPRLYSLLQTFPAYTQSQVLDSYQQCLRKGVLFETLHDEEPCVHTLHSLVAEKITKVSGASQVEIDDELFSLAQQMTYRNLRDLEIIRRLLKQINDYGIMLSSEHNIDRLFEIATESTDEDWVVCQQFSKYLLRGGNCELAFVWAERALEKNPTYSSLLHHKGNVLRRWGMDLKADGYLEEANQKFNEARKYFTLSRAGQHPNEYGYVTHLEMLLYLVGSAQDETEKANLLAEGAQLLREGVRVVPQDQFNLLLDKRFHMFDLKGQTIDDLCKKIEQGIVEGKSSAHAATFLAERYYMKGGYDQAVSVLERQKKISDEGVLIWVKEAELHAREGRFSQAAKSIHSARLRERNAENAKVMWELYYWDLIISVVLEDFEEAREVSRKLAESNFLFGQRLPRGYIWRETARRINPAERSFKDHGKIWSGTVQNVRIAGRYGRIMITNAAGEAYYIDFNPKYFSRRDLRDRDVIKFVITFLPTGLRADSIDSKPFVHTVDDIFVKE